MYLLCDDAEVTCFFPLRHTRLGSSDSDECKKAFFSRLMPSCEIAEYRLSYSALSANEPTISMKQARVAAMTCTHAAIARSHPIELGLSTIILWWKRLVK
jgi:hypothetical protein